MKVQESTELWRDLATAHLIVERALEQRLQRDAQISVPEFDVLQVLSGAPDGRLRPRDLGLELRWEKSRVSHQLRRMSVRGLVGRILCSTDGRGTLMTITEEGSAAFRAAEPGYREVLRQRLDALVDPADLATLARVTQRIFEAVAPDCAENDG